MTQIRYQKANARTPLVMFRCPTPRHRDEIRAAATAGQVSVSEWIRLAVAEKLARGITAPST
jgi:hypothetical protein